MRALDALPRIAELSLKAGREAGSLALAAARTVAAPVRRRRANGAAARSTRNWEPPYQNGAAAAAAAPPAPAAAPPVPATRAVPPEPAEPEHVDRDAVVVAESADAGATGGAGAEIRVDEPWEGYGDLTVKEVTAQLATADPATLAVVRLYESANRNRRTLLVDVDRRIAAAER